MSKVTVLGGCGAVGSIATQTLASSGVFSEITVADIDIQKARELVTTLGGSDLSVAEVDAENPQSIRKAIAGSSVVLNCVGPFYKYGPIIMKAVIESKINYGISKKLWKCGMPKTVPKKKKPTSNSAKLSVS